MMPPRRRTTRTRSNDARVTYNVGELLEELRQDFEALGADVTRLIGDQQKRVESLERDVAIQSLNAAAVPTLQRELASLTTSVATLTTTVGTHVSSSGHPSTDRRLQALAIEVAKIAGMVALGIALLQRIK